MDSLHRRRLMSDFVVERVKFKIENRRHNSKYSNKLEKIGGYVNFVGFDPLKTSLSDFQAEAENTIKIVEHRHCD